MVLTRTHGIDNTHNIDLDSWYRNGTPESHTYERAEGYLYADFFLKRFIIQYNTANWSTRRKTLGSFKQLAFLDLSNFINLSLFHGFFKPYFYRIV